MPHCEESLTVDVKEATKKGFSVARGGEMLLISQFPRVRQEEGEWV